MATVETSPSRDAGDSARASIDEVRDVRCDLLAAVLPLRCDRACRQELLEAAYDLWVEHEFIRDDQRTRPPIDHRALRAWFRTVVWRLLSRRRRRLQSFTALELDGLPATDTEDPAGSSVGSASVGSASVGRSGAFTPLQDAVCALTAAGSSLAEIAAELHTTRSNVWRAARAAGRRRSAMAADADGPEATHSVAATGTRRSAVAEERDADEG